MKEWFKKITGLKRLEEEKEKLEKPEKQKKERKTKIVIEEEEK